MVAFLLQGLALGLAAAASPGPFQAFIIHQSLNRGGKRAAPLALAPLLSDGPIITLVLLLLMRLPLTFLRLISLTGGVYVLYLAWGLWRQWRESDPSLQAHASRGGGLWHGVLINALSPGPYTFWTLVNGPLLLTALRYSWLHGGMFLLGFYLAMITSLLGIILLFHQARRLGPKIIRALTLFSIVILVVFGALLLKHSLG